MAELFTIARPYAEAAFKLAKETGALPAWSDALARLTAVAQSPVMQTVLGNPKFTGAQLATLVSETAGVTHKEQLNFVSMLANNDRIAVLPEITKHFGALRNATESVVEAAITSAYPLSDEQLAQIVQTLEAKSGKKVKATVSVDADLIGGVSIRIGDEVTDTSVRGKLAQLAATLKN